MDCPEASGHTNCDCLAQEFRIVCAARGECDHDRRRVQKWSSDQRMTRLGKTGCVASSLDRVSRHGGWVGLARFEPTPRAEEPIDQDGSFSLGASCENKGAGSQHLCLSPVALAVGLHPIEHQTGDNSDVSYVGVGVGELNSGKPIGCG